MQDWALLWSNLTLMKKLNFSREKSHIDAAFLALLVTFIWAREYLFIKIFIKANCQQRRIRFCNTALDFKGLSCWWS